MVHPTYLREKARELRSGRQLTLDEIVERLALPKTTIYYWIADLPLTRQERSPRQTAAQQRGTRAMQAKYRRLRAAAYEQGLTEFPQFCEEPTFRDFVCLYIAEGYKRSRNTVSVGNSDVAVLKAATHWISRLGPGDSPSGSSITPIKTPRR